MDELTKQIANAIGQLQAQFQAHLPMLETAVNNLILSATQDIKEIEQLIDVLLDYQYLGIGKVLFFKMLDYYKTIDAVAVAEYLEIYEEI